MLRPGDQGVGMKSKKHRKRPHEWRLFFLALQKRRYVLPPECAPEISPNGVRMSALKGHCHDRIKDLAYPYPRKMILTCQMHRNVLGEKRLQSIRKNIDSSTTSLFCKYANCYKDVQKRNQAARKKNKSWTESDWKKHGAVLNKLAKPKTDFSTLQKPKKKKIKPLPELMPRLMRLAVLPDYKCYRRPSQESTYRDPIKVSPSALTYKISDRVKKLAVPRKSFSA